MKRPKLHDALDVDAQLVEQAGDFAIQRVQEIPLSFRAALRQIKAESNARAKEFHHTFSVPVLFVEKMLREGFDFYRESRHAIEGWLRKHDLDDFIVTRKRI